MKKNYILCLLATLIILASCKKDDPNSGNSSINGTYMFSGMQAKTSSTITADDGEKVITLSDWTSTDNKGTITFKDEVATSANIGYSVNSEATGYFYLDNILIDSVSSPFQVTIPPSNSVSAYRLSGSDSIYFPGGGLISFGTSTTSGNPAGGHYTISGNQLTVDMSAIKDSSYTDSGTLYTIKQSVVASITLIKQ